MKAGLRDLDQIQEAEAKPSSSRFGTFFLVSAGGACLVFALASQVRRAPAPPVIPPDPLGDLVTRSHGLSAAASLELASKDVTFPGILSDQPHTTTALAAIRPSAAASSVAALAASGAAVAVPAPTPPPPADRLMVVPLPAKNVVVPSPLVSRPRDALTQIAKEGAVPSSPLAEEGRPGGYQLQASSFRSDTEAASFAAALRQRGHRAYVEPTQVPGRGTWYRVRVGPFRSQREAAAYRTEFEHKEHLAPFLVEPPRDKVTAHRP